MSKIKVKLVKSPIGFNKKQRVILQGLGLRHLHQERELINTAAVRGMVRKVVHLVEVELA